MFTIYYVDGNHEHLAEMLNGDQYNEFISFIEDLGIVFLKDNYVDITIE